MTLFNFLLIIQALIAAIMIGVILMQRSEGGGLGMGGSPAGMLSARGAADFLTRSTAVLATLFVALSIVLAAMAATRGGTAKIDTSLVKGAPAAPSSLTSEAPAAPAAGPAPQAGVPLDGDPLAAGAQAIAGDAEPGAAQKSVPLD